MEFMGRMRVCGGLPCDEVNSIAVQDQNSSVLDHLRYSILEAVTKCRAAMTKNARRGRAAAWGPEAVMNCFKQAMKACSFAQAVFNCDGCGSVQGGNRLDMAALH
jgi:hypothetical protein